VKSKLILKEYMKMFDTYLADMRAKDANINELIINTTRNAIFGINKYLVILNRLETSLEPPTTYKKLVHHIKSNVHTHHTVLDKIEGQIDSFKRLKQEKKEQTIKELEDLLMKQMNMMALDDEPNDGSNVYEDSFRKIDLLNERILLREGDSQKQREE
jgi:hypothetical protein